MSRQTKKFGEQLCLDVYNKTSDLHIFQVQIKLLSFTNCESHTQHKQIIITKTQTDSMQNNGAGNININNGHRQQPQQPQQHTNQTMK